MRPIITLSGDRPIEAELEYIYDAEVLSGGLKGTLAHPPLTLWAVREGSVQIQFSGGHAPLRGGTGDLLLLPPLPRRHRIRPGTRLLSCRFHLRSRSAPLAWQSAAPFMLNRDPAPLIAGSEQLEQETTRLFGSHPARSGYADAPPEAWLDDAFHWQSLFAAWIRAFLREVRYAGWQPQPASSVRPVMDRSLKMIDAQGWRNGFRGEDLARECGISLSQFKRRFRAESGEPFKQWLDRERLRQISSHLQTGDLSLKEIAFEYGFSSPSHFSAWFRRHCGSAPLAYRKSVGRVGI